MAGKLKGDPKLTRLRVNAALDVLREQQGVDAKKIAAIGYCFGGMCVLELARSGAEVAGIVSFHGSYDTATPEDMKNFKGRALILQGSADPVSPPEKVAALEKELSDAGVDWQFVTYGGAAHAFTNPSAGNDPSKGAAYDPKAAARSWQAMQDFFGEIFGK
jgi:dienelactone hydrolase